jgi:hypothetical protein
MIRNTFPTANVTGPGAARTVRSGGEVTVRGPALPQPGIYDSHRNFAVGTVLTPPSPALSGTLITLGARQGARFPAPPFNVTTWPVGLLPDPTNTEVMRVTSVLSDVLTVVRAQEGTPARAIGFGDYVAVTVTSKVVTDIERIGTRYFHVEDYGAFGISSGEVGALPPDETTQIQAAINACIAAGGGVVKFRARKYVIGTGLTFGLVIGGSGVVLEGDGSWIGTFGFGTSGTPRSGTIITVPAAGWPVVAIQFSPFAVPGGLGGRSCGIRNLSIDGSGNCPIGLQLVSQSAFYLYNVHIANCGAVGLATGTSGVALGDERGTKRSLFERLSIWNDSTDGICLQLDGDSTLTGPGGVSNTNNCLFIEMQLLNKNGIAIKLIACDHNKFIDTQINSIGTGLSIEFNGSNLGDVLTANGNTFYCLSPGTGAGKVVARGTASYTFPSRDNAIERWDFVQSGGSVPTVEAGAGLVWYEDVGFDISYSRLSADRGDASVTIKAGSDAPVQMFKTPLTANRTVTLSLTGVNSQALPIGVHFRITRTAAATGASTLTVQTLGGGNKALAVGQWIDVVYDGTAWQEVAFGSL